MKHSPFEFLKKYRIDIAMVIGILLIAGIIFMAFSLTKHAGQVAVVTVNEKEVERLSLSENCEKRVELQNGDYNIVVIRNGKVEVREANCPNQICVNHYEISETGETIICLPHKLVVTIVEE